MNEDASSKRAKPSPPVGVPSLIFDFPLQEDHEDVRALVDAFRAIREGGANHGKVIEDARLDQPLDELLQIAERKKSNVKGSIHGFNASKNVKGNVEGENRNRSTHGGGVARRILDVDGDGPIGKNEESNVKMRRILETAIGDHFFSAPINEPYDPLVHDADIDFSKEITFEPGKSGDPRGVIFASMMNHPKKNSNNNKNNNNDNNDSDKRKNENDNHNDERENENENNENGNGLFPLADDLDFSARLQALLECLRNPSTWGPRTSRAVRTLIGGPHCVSLARSVFWFTHLVLFPPRISRSERDRSLRWIIDGPVSMHLSRITETVPRRYRDPFLDVLPFVVGTAAWIAVLDAFPASRRRIRKVMGRSRFVSMAFSAISGYVPAPETIEHNLVNLFADRPQPALGDMHVTKILDAIARDKERERMERQYQHHNSQRTGRHRRNRSQQFGNITGRSKVAMGSPGKPYINSSIITSGRMTGRATGRTTGRTTGRSTGRSSGRTTMGMVSSRTANDAWTNRSSRSVDTSRWATTARALMLFDDEFSLASSARMRTPGGAGSTVRGDGGSETIDLNVLVNGDDSIKNTHGGFEIDAELLERLMDIDAEIEAVTLRRQRRGGDFDFTGDDDVDGFQNVRLVGPGDNDGKGEEEKEEQEEEEYDDEIYDEEGEELIDELLAERMSIVDTITREMSLHREAKRIARKVEFRHIDKPVERSIHDRVGSSSYSATDPVHQRRHPAASLAKLASTRSPAGQASIARFKGEYLIGYGDINNDGHNNSDNRENNDNDNDNDNDDDEDDDGSRNNNLKVEKKDIIGVNSNNRNRRGHPRVQNNVLTAAEWDTIHSLDDSNSDDNRNIDDKCVDGGFGFWDNRQYAASSISRKRSDSFQMKCSSRSESELEGDKDEYYKGGKGKGKEGKKDRHKLFSPQSRIVAKKDRPFSATAVSPGVVAAARAEKRAMILGRRPRSSENDDGGGGMSLMDSDDDDDNDDGDSDGVDKRDASLLNSSIDLDSESGSKRTNRAGGVSAISRHEDRKKRMADFNSSAKMAIANASVIIDRKSATERHRRPTSAPSHLRNRKNQKDECEEILKRGPAAISNFVANEILDRNGKKHSSPPPTVGVNDNDLKRIFSRDNPNERLLEIYEDVIFGGNDDGADALARGESCVSYIEDNSTASRTLLRNRFNIERGRESAADSLARKRMGITGIGPRPFNNSDASRVRRRKEALRQSLLEGMDHPGLDADDELFIKRAIL